MSLALDIVLRGKDQLSKVFRGSSQSSEALTRSLRTAGENVRKLEKVAAQTEGFRQLKQTVQGNRQALAAAETATRSFGKNLNDIKQKASSLAATIATSKEELSALTDDEEIRKAADAIKLLEAEQRKVAKEATTAERVFDKQRQALGRLRDVAQADHTALQQLRSTLAASGVNTRSLSSETIRLRQNIEASRQSIQREAEALQKAKNRAEALTRAREKLARTRDIGGEMQGKGMGAMAGGGVALAGAAAITMPGIDFEKQMSKVGALARIDKTSEAFKKLEDQAVFLGASTSFSAGQAASGMQQLSAAGFTTQETFDAMPGTLNLAAAAGMDVGETASIAANALRGFGISAKDMGRVSDVLTATFTRSNTTLYDLGETMKYIAPVAKGLGTSIEDASAMAGLLGNVGIKGSEAGTALRAIHTRLAAPAEEGRNALKALGISAKDAKGNLRPMTDILADVAKKTEKMGNAKRAGIFKTLAGEEAGAAFAALVEQQGIGEIVKMADVLRQAQGEAKKVADTMNDNASGDIDGFTGALETLQITLYKTNTSPLRDLIQSATSVVNSVTDWIKANPELAATLVKVAAGIGALMLAGGALTVAIGTMLGPLAMLRYAAVLLGGGPLSLLGGSFTALGGVFRFFSGGVVPLVVRGLGLVGTAFRVLGVAMAANPLMAVVAVVATIAGLVIANWDLVGPYFTQALGWLKDAFSWAWEGIKSVLSWTPIGLLVSNWGTVSGFFSGLLSGIPTLASAAWEGVKTIFGWTPLGMVIENWQPISTFFTGLWDGIGQSFSGWISSITSRLASLKEAVTWVADKVGLGGGPDGASPPTSAPPVVRPVPSVGAAAARPGAAAAAGSSAVAGSAITQNVTFNITALPGVDPALLAQQIRAELDKLTRSARSSGAYHDGVD